MKLEVGMYVRTNKGYIGKLKKHYLGSITEPNEYVFENDYGFSEADYEYITKSSFNLIDLIEVGDYVNGEYMLEHYLQHDRIEHTYNSYWYEQDIKEILTHEQYEANCYKVGE